MASSEQLGQDLSHKRTERAISLGATAFWTIAEGVLFINSALDILSVKQPNNVWFAILVLKIGLGIVADRLANVAAQDFHTHDQEVTRLESALDNLRRGNNIT